MNQGPLIFLGLFAAMSLSWFGLIVQPQMQLGRATPGTNTFNTAETYPQARAGLAQQGLQVYRSLGCASCHSQQVRQDGITFDVVLNTVGTNTADLVEAIRKLKGTDRERIGPLLSSMPATVLTGLTDKAQADAAAKSLDVGGAKVQVRLIAMGADIDRGWGRARTVAADFLFDQPALPGSLRLGPDLATVGVRLPSAEWHYRHLYAPRTLVPKSTMPPYRFLFEKRLVGRAQAQDAFRFASTPADAVLVGSRTNFTSGLADPARPAETAEEIVPTDEARALVAYLLSLRAEVALFERPFSAAITVSTNAPGTPGGTNAPVTNAAPTGAAATNR